MSSAGRPTNRLQVDCGGNNCISFPPHSHLFPLKGNVKPDFVLSADCCPRPARTPPHVFAGLHRSGWIQTLLRNGARNDRSTKTNCSCEQLLYDNESRPSLQRAQRASLDSFQLRGSRQRSCVSVILRVVHAGFHRTQGETSSRSSKALAEARSAFLLFVVVIVVKEACIVCVLWLRHQHTARWGCLSLIIDHLSRHSQFSPSLWKWNRRTCGWGVGWWGCQTVWHLSFSPRSYSHREHATTKIAGKLKVMMKESLRH